MLLGVSAQILFTSYFMFFRRQVLLWLWWFPELPYDNSAGCNHSVLVFITYLHAWFSGQKLS